MEDNKKRRRNIHEISSENDMKYRGLLSARHFKIFGWVCLILMQISNIIYLYARITEDMNDVTFYTVIVLSIIGNLALPFFLISNFAAILCDKNNLKKQLIKFGALSIGGFIAFLYVYEHIIMNIFTQIGTRADADELLATLFPPLAQNGLFAFNIFIDLFLCTLTLFFLDYTPKHIFKGKSVIAFRLFSLIPILYESVAIILKLAANEGVINVSYYLFPFLPTKPPMAFAVFVALALFIKRRERKFIKNGKTKEEYEEFLKTKTNSFHFSVHSAIIIAVSAIIDFIILIVIAAVISKDTKDDQSIINGINAASSMGFGNTLPMIFIAPLMLLFSYNRQYKNSLVDLIIPAGGVLGIIFAWIEGGTRIIIGILSKGTPK